jgi:hypothetical protein
LRSRYSKLLRAGRLRGRSLSLDRVKNFHFTISFRPAMGLAQPAIQWVPEGNSPGVKRQGREADHSLPIVAEVKKSDNFTFYLTMSSVRCGTQMSLYLGL